MNLWNYATLRRSTYHKKFINKFSTNLATYPLWIEIEKKTAQLIYDFNQGEITAEV